MRDLSILVTGVGGDIGENIVKCLNKINYNLKVYGCDIDKYASGKARVGEFFLCPPVKNEEGYINFLRKLIEEKEIDYIFPSTEIELEYFHKNRKLFNDSKARIMINNEIIMDNFLDKYKTSLLLQKNGITSPKTFLIEKYKGELSYPLIVKKRSGSGSKLVLIVNNDSELEFYKKKYEDNDLIVQEYLGDVNQEYTIGVFSNGDKIYSIIFRRYLFGDVGVTKFTELILDSAADQLAIEIATAVKLKGAINVQARKVGDKFIPFEINPRLSGTVYIRHYFGFQDVKWWIDINENNDVVYVPQYKKGMAVRAISEVFYDVS